MPKPISEAEISVKVAPASLRWPADPVIHWQSLHKAVAHLREVIRQAEKDCAAVEADPDLSPQGLQRKRTEIGRRAIAALVDGPLVARAETAVAKALSQFESEITADIPKPKDAADVALAQEIRQHIARQKSSFDFVMRNLRNPQVLGAVLHAPTFLTGLDDTMIAAIRAKAATAQHPEKLEMKKAAEGALEELRKGIASAKRMVLARTETVEDAHSGLVRGIREPMPGGVAGESPNTQEVAAE